MDLGLELSDLGLHKSAGVRTRGRAAKPVEVEVVRELTAADIATREQEQGIRPEPLRRLTQRHRMLARLLAGGTKPGVAAVAVGMAASRVSILQSDPSFRDLVTYYERETDEEFIGTFERLSALANDALDEFAHRLEHAPDDISNGMLKELIELATDRTGHGPQSSSNVNVNLGIADRLRAARERVMQNRPAPMIEGEVIVEETADDS